jgi:hypothetical protein
MRGQYFLELLKSGFIALGMCSADLDRLSFRSNLDASTAQTVLMRLLYWTVCSDSRGRNLKRHSLTFSRLNSTARERDNSYGRSSAAPSGHISSNRQQSGNDLYYTSPHLSTAAMPYRKINSPPHTMQCRNSSH